ncbi:alkaline phosphatase family protein [uncultured Acetobacteroides sp.]|uniref:alkaline phosphatase family protein n=1 Tax=uncultured Acetobacteroides sp. TaxID=1760811 RepID=UPI0029F4F98C|nr:alkaline phosphatase family protein [uncultured Acetobacteroides sp.]
MYKISVAAASMLIASCAFGQGRAIPSEKPKLIVEIVVTQMRYDYLQRYHDNFSDNGFRVLLEEGAVCKNAKYSYSFTQSAPGLATIATGTNPSTHGVVGDMWYIPLTDQNVKAVQDSKAEGVGGFGELGKVSPRNLLAGTLADEIKMANKNSKVIGVALEPTSAVFLAGHSADAAYWFDPSMGKFMTSSYYMPSLPKWVDEFNQKKFPDIYIYNKWGLTKPLSKYISSKDNFDTTAKPLLTNPDNGLGGMLKSKSRPTYEKLMDTPYGNNLTKDFAIAAIVNEGLGKDEATDLLTITLDANKHIGQKYGPTSMEMEDTYYRLDEDIAHLIKFLADNIGKQNVLVVLTSDNGVANAPKFIQKEKIPAGYFELNRSLMLLKIFLNATYGRGDWVKAYHQKQIYLNHTLIEDSKINLGEMQAKVANFLKQFTGVAQAIPASVLEYTSFTDGIMQKMQNSFYAQRSGDVVINLQPGWIDTDEVATSSNSPYSYDTHVPLIWYGWKIKRESISSKVDPTDIAPTIANLLDISWSNAASGEPINELAQ